MAIDRIPGVGPTNADIATAVAAPSAATIAAAVAAPSAATIAAAVAAPSSATIASAVAAAVPTIGAINTSVANNAPSPVNWVFLGSANLQNVASATISFSAYRKLRLIVKVEINGGTPQNPRVRFNGDTTNGNYFNICRVSRSSTTPFPNIFGFGTSGMFFGNNDTVIAGSAVFGYFDIENASLTSTKFITSENYVVDNNSVVKYTTGFNFYIGGSAITSINLSDTASNTFANTTPNQTAVQVWGMN
jgi:hypothetical protein